MHTDQCSNFNLKNSITEKGNNSMMEGYSKTTGTRNPQWPRQHTDSSEHLVKVSSHRASVSALHIQHPNTLLGHPKDSSPSSLHQWNSKDHEHETKWTPRKTSVNIRSKPLTESTGRGSKVIAWESVADWMYGCIRGLETTLTYQISLWPRVVLQQKIPQCPKSIFTTDYNDKRNCKTADNSNHNYKQDWVLLCPLSFFNPLRFYFCKTFPEKRVLIL